MKYQQYLKRIALMLFSACAVWIFWPSIPVEKTQKTTQVTVKKTSEQTFAQLEKVEVTDNHVSVVSETISSNNSAALVAKVYAAELNYPPYSQPLTDVDFDRLQPNYFNPQSIPVDNEGNEITAALSKFRYTYPEPILATLQGDNIVNAELQLIDTNSGEVLVSNRFEQEDNSWHVQLNGDRDLPRQLHATVRANVNNKTITMALALKYIDPIATLEGFDSAFTRDADMIVPAQLTTKKQGLYRVRANLFDANHHPIAHLVTKKKLRQGSNEIELKAHQSVLQGKQPPFHLATFSIELMSPAPGKPTQYGNSSIKKYEIKDFAVSSLSDVSYQPSAQEQQRLQLLQKMSQG